MIGQVLFFGQEVFRCLYYFSSFVFVEFDGNTEIICHNSGKLAASCGQ